MNRILIDPKIMHGRPVIKGTRVPVDVILGSLVGGMSYEDIEKESGKNQVPRASPRLFLRLAKKYCAPLREQET